MFYCGNVKNVSFSLERKQKWLYIGVKGERIFIMGQSVFENYLLSTYPSSGIFVRSLACLFLLRMFQLQTLYCLQRVLTFLTK